MLQTNTTEDHLGMDDNTILKFIDFQQNDDFDIETSVAQIND